MLVIDLRVPELGDHVNDQQLLAALGSLWPRSFAYVLSFAVISLYWLAHWRRFPYIERVAEPLILLNLLLLGLIRVHSIPDRGRTPIPPHSIAVEAGRTSDI